MTMSQTLYAKCFEILLSWECLNSKNMHQYNVLPKCDFPYIKLQYLCILNSINEEMSFALFQTTYEEFRLNEADVGDKTKWLKEGMDCNLQFWNGKVIIPSWFLLWLRSFISEIKFYKFFFLIIFFLQVMA